MMNTFPNHLPPAGPIPYEALLLLNLQQNPRIPELKNPDGVLGKRQACAEEEDGLIKEEKANIPLNEELLPLPSHWQVICERPNHNRFYSKEEDLLLEQEVRKAPFGLVVDWDEIKKLFPGRNAKALSHHWRDLCKKRPDLAQLVQEREAFVKQQQDRYYFARRELKDKEAKRVIT